MRRWKPAAQSPEIRPGLASWTGRDAPSGACLASRLWRWRAATAATTRWTPDLDIPAAYRATAATAAAAWPAAGLVDRLRLAGTERADRPGARAELRHPGGDRPGAAGRRAGADRRRGAAADAERHGVGRVGASRDQYQQHVVPRRRRAATRAPIFARYSVGLSAAYQLDFWGHNLAHRQSAIASAEFSRFDQRTVALTVVTNVANTWFTALALADRLAVARRNVADSEQTLAVIRGRLQAGTASALDVANQATLVCRRAGQYPEFPEPTGTGADQPGHPGRRAAGADHGPARHADGAETARWSPPACPRRCWSGGPTSPRPRRS